MLCGLDYECNGEKLIFRRHIVLSRKCLFFAEFSVSDKILCFDVGCSRQGYKEMVFLRVMLVVVEFGKRR